MEPALPEATTSAEVEQVLLDTLVLAHQRYATLMSRVCQVADEESRPLRATDVGGLLVARSEFELAAVAVTFDLRDHWALTGTGRDDFGDLRAGMEAAVDRIRDREEVLGALRLSLARNRVRARELGTDPGRLDCDVFYAEVMLERRAVEVVAGDVLETGRGLFVWATGLTGDVCWC